MGAGLSIRRGPRRQNRTEVYCPDGADITRIEIEPLSHQTSKGCQRGNLCQSGCFAVMTLSRTEYGTPPIHIPRGLK